MPTTQLSSNGFSPPSESTPESSPGPSPKRHCLQGPPTYGAIESAAIGGLAARACEKCRASKRKCDKKLPFCDRCKRLNAKCHYVQDISNNVNSQAAQFVIYQSRSLSHDALFRGAEPLEGISASQILSLISMSTGPGVPHIDWRTAVTAFFVCIHPWFAAVHPTLFERQLVSLVAVVDSPPQSDTAGSTTNGHIEHPFSTPNSSFACPTTSDWSSKGVALLIVAMYLTTRMRITDVGEHPIFDETYRTAKRLLSSLLLACVGDPSPGIELVQCGVLLALYEYGHGDAVTAYRTLSQTVVTARIMDIQPGQLAECGDDTVMLSMEEEQSGCLWWAMFILEQFVQRDDGVKHLPFLLETPSRNTLLPETPPMTPASLAGPDGSDRAPSPPPPAPSANRPVSTSVLVGTAKLASFQLSAKSASLFHQAIRVDKDRDSRPGKMPLVATYAALDQEIRGATKTLLRDSTDWEAALDCFAMLIAALFTLYLPYLSVLEHATEPAAAVLAANAEVRTALAALRFACKMSTDISCKINEDFEARPRNPARLSAPAGATCYLVVLALASMCRIFPEQRAVYEEDIVSKFESLKLFSSRWGLADKMMSQLEKKLGLDRSHYLKDCRIQPPSYAVCLDFGRR
ncbi:hypothetical protein F5Y05DRAFT_411332 [Hypoxylon sp. FL0543]|nr:hypothetical protein F5Y05DRAFT_411332 [Hypoxylon sp. FL0543]